MTSEGYSIRCDCHNYITLNWNGQQLFCLDNDRMYAEEMIDQIERRTRMKFRDIPLEGSKDDFRGLRFLNGGWKRDFWKEFPDAQEIAGYMKLKHGRI